MTVFCNGIKRRVKHIGPDVASSWNRSYPLTFGSQADGSDPWKGFVKDFSVSAGTDTMAVHTAGSGKKRSWQFRFEEYAGGDFGSSGNDSTLSLFVPEYYAPYTRTFLFQNFSQFLKNRIYFRDVFFNIGLFLPLGFLIAFFFLRHGHSAYIAVTAAALIGMLDSLCIEFLQMYIPERFSSLSDVLSNSAGALAGALLFLWIWKRVRDVPPAIRR